MRLEKRELTGREKDRESIELLEKLRKQLYSSNLTLARQTAFNLSWLQEDGMEILQEAILSNTSRKTKGAAAYGLRKMRGRMRKPARTILEDGAQNSNPNIAMVCRNALNVLDGKHTPYKRHQRRRGNHPRFEIRDLPPRGNRRVSNNSPRRTTNRPRYNR